MYVLCAAAASKAWIGSAVVIPIQTTSDRHHVSGLGEEAEEEGRRLVCAHPSTLPPSQSAARHPHVVVSALAPEPDPSTYYTTGCEFAAAGVPQYGDNPNIDTEASRKLVDLFVPQGLTPLSFYYANNAGCVRVYVCSCDTTAMHTLSYMYVTSNPS